MNRNVRVAGPIGLALSLSLATSSCTKAQSSAGAGAGLKLVTVASELEAPVHLATPTGDPRLFVVEQPGRIRILRDGKLVAKPFLDITDRVGFGGERGLLSVAFHPQYATNGRFFVDYTDRNGDTHIERYTVTKNPDVADPASATLLLKIEQPYENHNGGQILFAPDGMLWIGMGDGGSGGDPHRNGQNPRALLAKMLRIDVDHGTPYAIPKDNPWADGKAGAPEIWATGVRNPWRFTIDRAENLLYIADVGQNKWEELDVTPADRAGLNYGWCVYEGLTKFRKEPGDHPEMTAPVVVYPHSDGCSITGGLVYRGRRMPELVGHYFYGDYCTGWIASLRMANGRPTQERRWKDLSVSGLSSFGEDSNGELYVMSVNGTVQRIEPTGAQTP